MTIKLFATDLDGTLLNGKKQITEITKKAFREMAQAGVIPTIATGRMYDASRRYAEQLELDVPIITYNGALIKSVSGKVFYEGFLEPELVSEIYEYCHQHDYYFQSYQDDKLYFEVYNEKSVGYENSIGVKGICIGKDIEKLTAGIPKILIITADNEESDAVVELFNRDFAGRAHAAKSQATYVEIMAPNVNKASGLKRLAEKLGFSLQEVMAIGDANNDVPMLREAGFSAVMGSAKDDVKQYGDVIVADCDHDGVAEAIYKYVLNKEI
ncbi:Cof-type HAD-IIB family hydrolase [Megamonas hypermegale]|uniref:Cof-type HAD-IIB family hydrolase n=1 Tax=Megamonas hypermegale TaxID=158847 RepID=UPI0026F34407|nr:Cof-type HAD-IIB family hydrolase [Megamonas hypermegale]